jgi:hypothetical protein
MFGSIPKRSLIFSSILIKSGKDLPFEHLQQQYVKYLGKKLHFSILATTFSIHFSTDSLLYSLLVLKYYFSLFFIIFYFHEKETNDKQLKSNIEKQ